MAFFDLKKSKSGFFPMTHWHLCLPQHRPKIKPPRMVGIVICGIEEYFPGLSAGARSMLNQRYRRWSNIKKTVATSLADYRERVRAGQKH